MGAVLISFTEKGLSVDAQVPFTLHLPMATSAQRPFKLNSNNAEGEPVEVIGQRYRKEKQFYLAFSLPKAKGQLWTYNE